jgi:hypothetical protein
MDVGCCMEGWSGSQQCYCSCTVHAHLVDPNSGSCMPPIAAVMGLIYMSHPYKAQGRARHATEGIHTCLQDNCCG